MTTSTYARTKWNAIIHNVISEIGNDDSTESLTSSEKLLSFYYELLEVLETESEFVKARYRYTNCFNLVVGEFKEMRKVHGEFIEEIIVQALTERELKDLSLVNHSYKTILWLQLMFILRYWVTDDSHEKGKTEVIIENSVKSFYDIFSKGDLKSSIDLTRYFLQNPIKIKWQI